MLVIALVMVKRICVINGWATVSGRGVSTSAILTGYAADHDRGDY
jgi:hypothetical protein